MQLKTSVTKCLGGLLLLLGSYTLINYVAVAQPPAEPETSTEQASEEAGDLDLTLEPVTAKPATQPFEDYEASEQISEDLSVAFPVDI